MMLSPAFGLLYFFSKGGEWFGDTWEKFNIKEFISLALVPVYVSAALAFGLVFIMVAAEWIKVNSDEPDTLKAGWFSLTLVWAHGEKSDDGTQDGTIIGKLIVEIFWVVILWIAVMSALWASKTTKAIVEPIAQFGKSVWELAAKAPTYAPIIPTWSGKWMSVTWLQQVWSTISSSAEQSARSRWSDFAKTLWGNANSIDLSTKSINALKTFEASWNRMTREWLDELKWAIKAWGSIKDLANDPKFVGTINTLVKNDSKFQSNGFLKWKSVTKWNEQELAQVLSEMDRVIDNEYRWIWNLMVGEKTWNSATKDGVNKRLFWTSNEGPINPTWATTSTRNINVKLGWQEMTPQAAVVKLAENNRAELSKKLDEQWVEPKDKNAILLAFDNLEKDNNDIIDWDSGSSDS